MIKKGILLFIILLVLSFAVNVFAHGSYDLEVGLCPLERSGGTCGCADLHSCTGPRDSIEGLCFNQPQYVHTCAFGYVCKTDSSRGISSCVRECLTNSDCRSGWTCDADGSCMDESIPDDLAENGEACDANSDCDSNNCYSLLGKCRSNNYWLGSCPTATNCNADRTACADAPNDQLYAPNRTCAPNYYCATYNSGCVPKRQNGLSCSADYECSSSICKQGICSAPVQDGGVCYRDLECIFNTPGSCYSAWYDRGVCRSNADWIGPCGDSYRCNSLGNSCLGSINKVCSSDTYCSNGSCVFKQGTESECTNDFQCLSGNCDNGLCAASTLEITCSSPIELGVPFTCSFSISGLVSGETVSSSTWFIGNTLLSNDATLTNTLNVEGQSIDLVLNIQTSRGSRLSATETISATGQEDIFQSCNSQSECAENQACYNGFCLIAPGSSCSSTVACPEGQACSSGRCFYLTEECSNTGDCDSGQICSQGLCGANSDLGPCPVGQFEYIPLDICRPSCESSECPTDQGCIEGICFPIDTTFTLEIEPEPRIDSIISDDLGLSCNDLDGRVCGSGETCLNGEPSESSTELNCCVATGNLNVGCRSAQILLREGSSVQYLKTCLDDGRTQVKVVKIEGGQEVLVTNYEELGISGNPYIDNTDYSCSNVDLGGSGERVPAFGLIGLSITLLFLTIFYFYRNRKLLKY